LIMSVVVVSALACRSKSTAEAAPVASVAKPNPPPGKAKLAKVVFVDKQNACPCTRKRVDDSWTALQTALGTPNKLPVERYYVDTQPAETAPYVNAQPLMVPPGIYFVDEQQKVREMLQGEVTAAQIAAVLTH
jgi:hypothetical protein